jgi:hypothetical protein
MVSENPYIAVVQEYQEASNLHDINACVALFAEDGRIEMNGEMYQGLQALRDAHEYDLASRTQVAFRDFVAEGDVIRCTFWNEHELDRVVQSGGTTSSAVFTFRNQKIHTFHILPPDEDEQQRLRTQVGSAFRWLRENHADVVAKWGSFDRAGGETVYTLAELWRKHREETKREEG